MSLKIQDINKIKGYERVIHTTNETTKLYCIVGSHDTKLGPALCGVRSWKYGSYESQKNDVLKCSEGMTLKNSSCGINFGDNKTYSLGKN